MAGQVTGRTNQKHTAKLKDGRVIQRATGGPKVDETTEVSLRDLPMDNFGEPKSSKVKSQKPSQGRKVLGNLAGALGNGAVKGVVGYFAVSAGLTALTVPLGGLGALALFGGPLMAIAPFAIGLTMAYHLADALDKEMKKTFLTKKEKQTYEEAEDTVQEWDDMDKEHKNEPKYPYTTKNRIIDGARYAFNTASMLTYYVIGDILGVPRAKRLKEINKQGAINLKRDRVRDRIRHLEHQKDQLKSKGGTGPRIKAIDSRIKFEEAKL